MRIPLWLVLSLPVAFAGCTDNTAFIIVTVDGRAAVHDVATLHVTLSNNGSDRSDDLVFTGKTFPATFSISAPGRSGDLAITIDALDASGIAVGHGTIQSTVEMLTANVVLDSTDFVINTDFAGNQFLSSDFEANGNQLATISNGTWTAAFRDDCLSPCNMFARRFDSNGVPVSSELAAGTNAFPLTTTLTTASSTPALASSGTTTLAFWDFDDESLTPAVQGVACRALDETGNSAGDEVTVASDALTDVVSATPLSNGNFAITWNASLTNEAVRGAVVTSDCTPVGVPVTVSVSTTAFSHRASIAASGSNIMYAWIDDTTGVHTRMASNANAFTSADTVVIAPTATEAVQHVRLTPFGNGVAVVVRWAPVSGTGDGRIELYQATTTGTLSGPPLLVTSKSGGDGLSVQSFGVTTAADGSVMVVWSACGTNGDGSGCGVFGQLVSASQTLSGGPISLATTTTGDQTNPSVTPITGGFVAGWADASAAEPDHAGSAARARIIYP